MGSSSHLLSLQAPRPRPGILPDQPNAQSWTCQGQWALQPPLRLCPLSRQHPRARRAPLAWQPPPCLARLLLTPTWEHSPCMSSPSPWGHGLRGGGSALPFERGWGGAAGWGGQAESPQFLHSKRGQERPQPPAQRAHWFPGAALSALHGPALGAHHLGTHLTKRETEARTGAVPCPASPNKWLLWDSNSPSS